MGKVYTISSEIHAFFKKAQESFLSLSYEDIRLIPKYSEVHPSEIKIDTHFSRNITLTAPIVSAAMDTVTEGKAGIQMALSGGIGMIHKNFHSQNSYDIEMQVGEVKKVKNHLHAMIREPIGFNKDQSLGELLDYKYKNECKFDTFVVYDTNQTLAGLITHSVLKYNRHNPEKKLKDIMVKDVYTSTSCTIQEAYQTMLAKQIGTIVITDSSNKVSGMYIFTDVENVMRQTNDKYTTDKDGRLRIGAAVGVNDDERVEALIEQDVDFIGIDSAHGDSLGVIEALKRYKRKYPHLDIVVGNISTAEAAKRLIQAGADALKVGQGPGQICSTRIISGIGVMQADAVYRVASVASKEGVPVIADGGIRYSGDIPIALACGANSVMIGQLLAGCKESPGELVQEQGNLFKIYRGMASLEAMSVKGGSDRYQKVATELKKLVPEGITKRIPYKGHLEDQIFILVEGAKAGLGYCGARDIDEFKSRAVLSRILTGGMRESHPDTKGMLGQPVNYHY